MKKVICVVEDEKAINDLVNQYLKKEGYEVRSYYTYEEAIAHVQDDDVHLWILDIMLDDKSGFDLIEEIRLQGRDIPVIFMSARDKEFDRIIGLEKGSDDYITKPYNPTLLLLHIEALFKRMNRQHTEEVYRGVKVNVLRSTLEKGGKELLLSKNEMAIFHFLLQHKGCIVSRDDLMDYLWDTNKFIDDNTLTVNITRLRRKLEEIGLVDVIETRRGQGYLLV